MCCRLVRTGEQIARDAFGWIDPGVSRDGGADARTVMSECLDDL